MSSFWPFSGWSVPQTLQKRLLKFLLKRAIGQFLAAEIDLDKLDVEFGKGHISLHDLELNLDVLNDLMADIPFLVTDGHIKRINAFIPWTDLGSSDCTLELDGLQLELRSVMEDPENGLSRSAQMSESHILSSSIHFAENFLRSEVSEDDDFGPMPDLHMPDLGPRRSSASSSPTRPAPGLEGIQVLTRLIDTILARVKVTAKNTVIRIVHGSHHSIHAGCESSDTLAYHLDLSLPFLMFEDETPELGTSVGSLPDAEVMDGDKLKVIRFSGITISLSELQSCDLPDPPAFEGQGDNLTTPQYSYSAVLASTSTKKEDIINLLVKGVAPSADRQQSAVAQLRVEVIISSLCAILLPEQLKVVFEVLQRLGAGEALLARNRDFGSQSETEYQGGLSGTSPNENQHSWPSHGYPAAGEYVAEAETTSDSHLRIQLDVAKMNIYAVTEWRHTSVDQGQFYSLFFGGQTATERRNHAEEVPSAAHVSTSFLTKVNTRLNTGTVSMDDILGEALNVGHVKIALSDLVACAGHSTEVGSNQEQQSELTVGMAQVSDWRAEPLPDGARKSASQPGRYHAMIAFEPKADVAAVYNLYSQLQQSSPPSSATYKPGSGISSWVKDTSRSQAPAIAISFRHRAPSVLSERVEAVAEQISVKLAPVHVYTDTLFLDRLKLLLPSQTDSDTEQEQFHVSQSSDSLHRSVGGIMEDLAQSTDSGEVSNAKRVVNIESSLIRVWLGLLGTKANESADLNRLQHTLFLDVVDLHIATYTEVTEHAVGRRASIGSGQHALTGSCLNTAVNQTRFISFDCRTAGLSLADGKQPVEGTTIKPFLAVTTAAPNQRAQSADVETRPIVQITLKQHVCESLLQRPYMDVFPSATGLRFQRESDDEASGAYGLQSWYDLGASGTSPKRKDAGAADDNDNDLLWFKQRTIEEALVHVDCQISTCYVNLTKETYDALQLLLNTITIQQSPAADSQPSPPPVRASESASPILTYAFGDQDGSISDRQAAGSARKPSSLSIVATCDTGLATLHADTKPDGNGNAAVKTYVFKVDGLRVFTVSGHETKPTLYTWIDAQDISLGTTAPGSIDVRVRNLYRTVPNALMPKQMLSVSFSITYDEELNMKETWASVNLYALAVESANIKAAIQDLSSFLKEPPEVVLLDLTNRFTKLHVNLSDACIEYQPVNLPTHATVLLDSVKISTNLIPDSPTVSVKTLLYNAALFIIDDDSLRLTAPAPMMSGYISTKRHYAGQGFVNVVSCDFLDLSVRTNSGNITPYFELDLTNNHVSVDTCADSHETLLSLIQYIADGGDFPTETPEYRPESDPEPVNLMSSVHGDVLDALDNHAFGPPEGGVETSCDLQMESMDDSFSPLSATPGTPGNESLSPGSSEDYDFGIGNSPRARQLPGSASSLEIKDKITVHEHASNFRVVDHFLSSADGKKGNSGPNTRPESSLYRARLHDLDLTWNIHDGYDWEAARQAVSKAQHEAHRRGKESEAGSSSASSANPETRTGRKSSIPASKAPGSRRSSSPPVSPFAHETSSDAATDYTTFDIGNMLVPTLQQPHVHRRSPSNDWREYDQEDVASSYSGTTTSTTATSKPHRHRHHRQRHLRRPNLPAELVRSQAAQVMLKIYALSASFDKYAEGAPAAYNVSVKARDFEIIDNVATSRWRKFLAYMRPEGNAAPRETSSNMLQIDLSSVRPEPERAPDIEELRLKVDILPLRLHVDQDALHCLLRFFAYRNPLREMPQKPPQPPSNQFFQLCDIQPLPIKIDYKPKHVDYANLKDGNLAEMLNFFQLDAAEMNLRGVRLTGVRGWSRIFEGVLGQWLPHIRSTQIPNMASGVSGVRSIVNIGSGLADLVLLPIEQYKKDGRIIRGLQKGAKSFAKTAASETIKIGTKLAVGTQGLLEQAEEILGGEGAGDNEHHQFSRPGSPGSSASELQHQQQQQHLSSKYSEQPSDLKEGVGLAYRSLSRNIATAARTVLAVPTDAYENNDGQGAVRAVMRAVPVAVLRPMIGATEAVSKTLMGIQNTMDPTRRDQMEDKYKG
ncbi:autophagy- protein 2 [Geranomyces variabilis]|nr:autophagy- protein 2 [Geranomyces variabilis]